MLYFKKSSLVQVPADSLQYTMEVKAKVYGGFFLLHQSENCKKAPLIEHPLHLGDPPRYQNWAGKTMGPTYILL